MGGIRSTSFFSSAGRSFRNLESLADRRIPINSPRVYQRPAMAGERTEGIAKQLQNLGILLLCSRIANVPKGRKHRARPSRRFRIGTSLFIPVRSGRRRIFSWPAPVVTIADSGAASRAARQLFLAGLRETQTDSKFLPWERATRVTAW